MIHDVLTPLGYSVALAGRATLLVMSLLTSPFRLGDVTIVRQGEVLPEGTCQPLVSRRNAAWIVPRVVSCADVGHAGVAPVV